MKTIRYLLIGLFILGFFGTALAQTFAFNSVETHALFKIKRLNVSYLFGRFNDISGTINYDAANPANSSIEFLILTESVSTGKDDPNNDFDAARRDGHLASPDFFDAAQFPTLSFVSKSVADAGNGNLSVTGDLTIHGVTKEITVTAEKTGEGQDQQGNALIGFYTEFTIDRTEFGMTNLLPVAPPEVEIMISILGIAQ